MLTMMQWYMRWYEAWLKDFCNSSECYSNKSSTIIAIATCWRVCATLLVLLQVWLPNWDSIEWDFILELVINRFAHSLVYLSLHSSTKFTSNLWQRHGTTWKKLCKEVMNMYRARPWQPKLQSILQLIPNCTNCYQNSIAIWANCYTEATKYTARIARISTQFDREIGLIHLGTESQEQYQSVQSFSTIHRTDLQSEGTAVLPSVRRCQGRRPIVDQSSQSPETLVAWISTCN
jgi:hypothetical protein